LRDRSSHFLLFLPACGSQAGLLHPRQIRNGCCTRPSLRSGCSHLPAIKILHRDKFLAPRQFVPRHCASAYLTSFYNRDNSRPLINCVPRHSYGSDNSYPDGKNTCHTLPACRQAGLHRDPSRSSPRKAGLRASG